MLSSFRPSAWPATDVDRATGPISAIVSFRYGSGFFRSPRCRPASGQRRNSFGNGFQLAHGFTAEQQRDERADRHDHKYRAEEDRRRTGVRCHHKWHKAAGEEAPERLAEDVAA